MTHNNVAVQTEKDDKYIAIKMYKLDPINSYDYLFSSRKLYLIESLRIYKDPDGMFEQLLEKQYRELMNHKDKED